MKWHVIALFLATILFLTTTAYSQQYVLNQDFSLASDSTPPMGWLQQSLSDNLEYNRWRFDNPGGQSISFPMIPPFAIFDAAQQSDDDNAETVALVTRLFDASTSNFILLMFDHVFSPGEGEMSLIEVNYGSGWRPVMTWDAATSNPASEILDISPTSVEADNVEGVRNARLRFVWSGDGMGFWAVDNVRIFAARPRDAALLAVNSPTMPFQAGNHPVSITLANYGFETLTSTTIFWEINGEPMGQISWEGNLAFGEKEEDIYLGDYDFQGPVSLRVWQSEPNGQTDNNPFNDLIERHLRPALTGSYTIGGNDHDFIDFRAAAAALNTAGVAGPVEFFVRPGFYNGQVTLSQIHGTSSEVTVTFRSENSDPQQTQLEFGEFRQTALRIRGTAHVRFEGVGFFGYNAISIEEQASGITFANCRFRANEVAMRVAGGANHVIVENSGFFSADTALVVGLSGERSVSDVRLSYNIFENIGVAAIRLSETNRLLIDNNDFYNVKQGVNSFNCGNLTLRENSFYLESTFGFPSYGFSAAHSEQIGFYNNFISSSGLSPATGLHLSEVSNARIYHNTINITNQDIGNESNAFLLSGGDQLEVINNIFCIKYRGMPISVVGTAGDRMLDHNNYYHPYQLIGRHQGIVYDTMTQWQTVTGGDHHSLSENPYFASDNDPVINHILIGRGGEPLAAITQDIDGVARDPNNPSMGAKEYIQCGHDAGINRIVAPENPTEPGETEVVVELQNHGTETLESVTIQWSVNGVAQPDRPLSGLALAPGDNMQVQIGSYLFTDGVVTLDARTTNPNGNSDCNEYNDAVQINILIAAPLCGIYYIGGSGDPFASVADAVYALSTSGIDCDVHFYVREGLYREQVVIGHIPGMDGHYTVTFEAYEGNTNQVVLEFSHAGQSPVRLVSARNISFRGIVFKGSLPMVVEGSESIEIRECLFFTDEETDPRYPCLAVTNGSRRVVILRSTFHGGLHSIALTPGSAPLDVVTLSENTFLGAASGALFADRVRALTIERNHFLDQHTGAILRNTNDAVIRQNKLQLHALPGERNTGFDIGHGNVLRIYNNFISTRGDVSSRAMRVENVNNSGIFFNSVNITSSHTGRGNKGLWLISGSDHRVINNCYFISMAGDPVHLQEDPGIISMDYNNYLSGRGIIVRNEQTTYGTLSTWQLVSGQDMHSLSEQPFYSSWEDLSINQSLLNNGGLPVAGITYDIDGTIRREHSPDIGAREFSLCDPDAGINAIVSPPDIIQPDPMGHQLGVLLQNHGNTTLNSVDINYEITSGSGMVDLFRYEWRDLTGLQGGESREMYLSDRFVFQSGLYTIRAWTELPGGIVDCRPENNVVEMTAVASLCGDYTIGTANADFLSLADAAYVLGIAGVSCPVRLFVQEGEYPENIFLGNIPGSDPVNNIAFIADTTQANGVLAGSRHGVQTAFTINEASYVRFEGIGFMGEKAVVIEDESTQITFERCSFIARDIAVEIKTGSNHIEFSECLFIQHPDKRTNNHVVIRNDGQNPVENVFLTGNIFAEPSYEAIHATSVRHLIVENNIFQDIHMGIMASMTMDLHIEKNWFYMVSHVDRNNMGIDIRRGEESRIINNFMVTTGSHQVTGIRFAEATHSYLFFNTFNVLNTHDETRALLLDRSTFSEIKNNIFTVAAGYPVNVVGHIAGLDIDFNNYYNRSSGIIGVVDGSTAFDITLWGSLIQGDRNSSNLDPLFMAYDDPLPQEKFFNGAGINIPGIVDDIYYSQRNDPPDIGCMEFYIDYGIVDLIEPNLGCLKTDDETIAVGIRRYGDIPLETIDIAVQINNGPIVRETISGLFDDIYIHTFEQTFDLSQEGEYRIRVWLDEIRDDDMNNDERSYVRFSLSPMATGIQAQFLCDEILFSAELVTNDTGATYFWNFGDGNSSVVQMPAHTYSLAGNYDVSLRVEVSQGCFVDLEKTLDFFPPDTPLTLTYNVTPPSCHGREDAQIQLTLSGGISPYQLMFEGQSFEEDHGHSFSDLSPGNYQFRATDAWNCDYDLQVDVPDTPPMNPLIIASEHEIYIPSSVSFTFAADHVDSHRWLYEDMIDDREEIDIYFDTPGLHTITLEVFSGDDGECMEQTQFAVLAMLRELIVTTEIRQQYCVGDPPPSATIHIEGGMAPYLVTTNGQTHELQEDQPLRLDSIDAGSYIVSVTDRYDQQAELEFVIADQIVINPVLFATEDSGVIPFDVVFSFTSDLIPASWEWRLGTHYAQNTTEQSFFFNQEGEFIVELEVYSGYPYHCRETAYYSITSERKVVITTVDIITPNGDGHNDYFEVLTKGVVDIKVDVFDRRGQKVYSFDQLDGRWGGDYPDGKDAPDGLYPYAIVATGFDGFLYHRAGNIQLIRDAVSFSGALNIYPNPSTGIVTIEIPGFSGGNIVLEVIDYQSNILFSQQILWMDEQLEFNLSGLPGGIYVVRVSGKNDIFFGKLWLTR